MTIPEAIASRPGGAPDSPDVGGAKPRASALAPPTSAARQQPPSGEQEIAREDEAARHPDADCRVVLDIGADMGALVLYAPSDLAGAEIEISRAPDPAAPAVPAARRTHAIVRERRIRPSTSGVTTMFAAVYPGLPAGTYTVWRDASTPAGTIQVRGGAVANWRWEVG